MFAHIRVYFGRFRHIQNPGTVRHEQLDIFMYIKVYSESMAYSDIFRTVDIFSKFKMLLNSNSCIFGTLYKQIQTYLELWFI